MFFSDYDKGASFENPSRSSSNSSPFSNDTEKTDGTTTLRLSSDASHNKTAREEFSYEQVCLYYFNIFE